MRKEYYLLHREEISVKQKKKYYENREKRLESARLYRINNLEKVTQAKIRNKQKYAGKSLERLYGITLDEYNKLLLKQNYCCVICGGDNNDKKNRKLAVDHCHTTKKVRGLLCKNCNLGLGYFKDNKSLLLKAIFYLK